jgi:RNA polymerase sigma-70 factor (ECF subfamily)
MRDSQSSKQTLIDDARNGDLDAFNQVVLAYQTLAYRHANALVDDPDSAEDITQESFIKAYQSLHGFRGGSFRVWLLKIVTNTSRDRWRRTMRHPSLPLFPEGADGSEIESPTWIADPTASIETQVQRNEESHALYRMVDELPADYRSVLTLIDIYELDYADAAQILGIPLGTVKSRLARARLRMKARLRSSFQVTLAVAV